MIIACDTSFLFSLYANDAYSQKSVNYIRKQSQSLSITKFNQFELLNAFRFAKFCKLIDEESREVYQSSFQSAINAGRLMLKSCNLADVLDEAERISNAYTSSAGHRSFDILHVAAALVMQADIFLTFDKNQKKMAVKENLTVPL